MWEMNVNMAQLCPLAWQVNEKVFKCGPLNNAVKTLREMKVGRWREVYVRLLIQGTRATLGSGAVWPLEGLSSTRFLLLLILVLLLDSEITDVGGLAVWCWPDGSVGVGLRVMVNYTHHYWAMVITAEPCSSLLSHAHHCWDAHHCWAMVITVEPWQSLLHHT